LKVPSEAIYEKKRAVRSNIETYVLFIPLAYNICQKNKSLTRDGSNVAYLNYAKMWNGDISVFTFQNENENEIWMLMFNHLQPPHLS
jgi:hypothetical protein